MCDAEFVPDDGDPLTCTRTGCWHIVHQAADGTTFTWAPGGAAYIHTPHQEA